MLKFIVFAAAVFVSVFCEQKDLSHVDRIQHRGKNLEYRRCPSQFTYLPEHYKCIFATQEPLPWLEAEKYCEKYGATLMSFHGMEEIQVAYKIVDQPFWVGLYKHINQYENAWKFASNEAVRNLHWTSNGNSYCASADYQRIDNIQPCDTKHFGICQLKA